MSLLKEREATAQRLHPRRIRVPGNGEVLATIAAIVVAIYILMAIVGPFLVPFDPIRVDTGNRLLPPGAVRDDGSMAIFGTDQVGQDVFAQTIYGARTSLLVGMGALAIQIILGVTAGVLSGYFGGWLDTLLMRLADIQLVFPGIVLAILIASVI